MSGSWRRWDTVIIPPKVFDSIKSLPENEMSFYGALDTVRSIGPLHVTSLQVLTVMKRFLHHLTTIKVPEEGGDTPMLKALAIDLPRHLSEYTRFTSNAKSD